MKRIYFLAKHETHSTNSLHLNTYFVRFFLFLICLLSIYFCNSITQKRYSMEQQQNKKIDEHF